MVLRPCLSLIALAGTLLGASVAARAQSAPYPLPSAPAASADRAPAGAPGAHRKGRMRAMLEKLNLTPDQRDRVATMFANFRQARTSGTPMTRKELRSNIEGVLTSDQRSKLQTMMRQHRRNAPAAPQPATT